VTAGNLTWGQTIAEQAQHAFFGCGQAACPCIKLERQPLVRAAQADTRTAESTSTPTVDSAINGQQGASLVALDTQLRMSLSLAARRLIGEQQPKFTTDEGNAEVDVIQDRRSIAKAFPSGWKTGARRGRSA
jgi:hypothetical protein